MDTVRQTLDSLGLPNLDVHHPFHHFDFTREPRIILVIGPMGSGKTEFSARVWRDAQVLRGKSSRFAQKTTERGADRRNVFFVRSALDRKRFPNYPPDALAYRGGFERLGNQIATVEDSWQLEELIRSQPEFGTWVVDEASFYEERLAYLIARLHRERGLTFILPTLLLNFRNEVFNQTARLLMEVATDVFPLTAYCEHPDCARDAHFTWRYYSLGGRSIPAPYFDPLIIVGGDTRSGDARQPNYETRCPEHHTLPAKVYTYLVLKPLAERYRRGLDRELMDEIQNLSHLPRQSLLWQELAREGEEALGVADLPVLAERALVYLCAEAALLTLAEAVRIIRRFDLDEVYFRLRIQDQHGAHVFKDPKDAGASEREKSREEPT